VVLGRITSSARPSKTFWSGARTRRVSDMNLESKG
jgi:hypothetical protein